MLRCSVLASAAEAPCRTYTSPIIPPFPCRTLQDRDDDPDAAVVAVVACGLGWEATVDALQALPLAVELFGDGKFVALPKGPDYFSASDDDCNDDDDDEDAGSAGGGRGRGNAGAAAAVTSEVVINDNDGDDEMEANFAAAAPAAGALALSLVCIVRCALPTAHHDCRRWRQPFVAA
jgi:hypothetical protein